MKVCSIQGYYPAMDFNSAVVIPCYKEEKRINVSQYLENAPQSNSHIFLVDDGSPDKTLDVLNKLHKSAPDRFSVIKSPCNQGKAEAVRLGLNIASDKNFRHIGFLDADLAVDFKEIPDFLKVFKDKKEINTVIGTRTRLAGHDIDRSLGKYVTQRVIAKMANVLFAPAVEDTQCGAKVFKTKVIKPTLKEKFISKWLFDQELLLRISRLEENQKKNWLFELPVKSWKEVGNSHVKASSYVSSLIDYFKIIKKYGMKKL